jgi:AcrR family transcriptional regulator
MHEQGMPLRERNRQLTWTSIHEAALALAREGDPTHATVEAISARAGISKRTFFNYFPTKEDAILGIQEPTLHPEALREFHDSDDDIVTRTVQLLSRVTRSMLRPGSHAARHELIRRFPELRTRLHQQSNAAAQLVEPVLTEQLAAEADREQLAGIPAEQAAQALVLLAAAVLRFAYNLSLSDNSDATDSPDADQWAAYSAALTRAIDTYRAIFREAK